MLIALYFFPSLYLTIRIFILKKCKLVLTDSGGIQEEAPAFAKPVLVLRNTTERIEALEFGTAKLVGTDSLRKYAETMVPGSSYGKHFINKYRKKEIETKNG